MFSDGVRRTCERVEYCHRTPSCFTCLWTACILLDPPQYQSFDLRGNSYTHFKEHWPRIYLSFRFPELFSMYWSSQDLSLSHLCILTNSPPDNLDACDQLTPLLYSGKYEFMNMNSDMHAIYKMHTLYVHNSIWHI